MRIKKISQTTPIQSQIVNTYNESEEDGYSCDYINKKNGTVLWTNSDPTQEFTSQTITLSSSDYDVLEFYFASSVSSANTFVAKAIKGTGTTVFVMINLNEDVSQETGIRLRNVSYASDTSYQVGKCLLRGGSGASVPTVVNQYLIPIYVVGYKTGLFNV